MRQPTASPLRAHCKPTVIAPNRSSPGIAQERAPVDSRWPMLAPPVSFSCIISIAPRLGNEIKNRSQPSLESASCLLLLRPLAVTSSARSASCATRASARFFLRFWCRRIRCHPLNLACRQRRSFFLVFPPGAKEISLASQISAFRHRPGITTKIAPSILSGESQSKAPAAPTLCISTRLFGRSFKGA